MNVLVTGAGGYIGSITAYRLLREGHSIIAVDNFERGFRDPLHQLQKMFPQKLVIRECDLSDSSTSPFTSADSIHVAIHCAARCIVDESVRQPEKYIPYNELLLQTVLQAMKQAGVKHIVFSSTAAVYGEPSKIPVLESAPIQPINPYGQSKVDCETALQRFSTKYDLNFVIFRYFNVCGASQDGLIGDSKKPSELLVQNAVRGALGIEPFKLTCSTVETPDGSPIRDFIDVEDLARAHVQAVEYLLNGGESTTLNLGSEKGFSVLQIVKTVETVTGKPIPIARSDSRLGEQAKMIADVSRAKTTLHWSAKRSLKDSVIALTKWYTTNPYGWQA